MYRQWIFDNNTHKSSNQMMLQDQSFNDRSYVHMMYVFARILCHKFGIWTLLAIATQYHVSWLTISIYDIDHLMKLQNRYYFSCIYFHFDARYTMKISYYIICEFDMRLKIFTETRDLYFSVINFYDVVEWLALGRTKASC